MSEWHITPDYIVNNWTDELFDLMLEKLAERKQREVKATRPASSPSSVGGGKVSDSILFAQAKNLIKVVKK